MYIGLDSTDRLIYVGTESEGISCDKLIPYSGPVPPVSIAFLKYENGIVVVDQDGIENLDAYTPVWLTALEFKRTLTSEERIGIRAKALEDPYLADFFEILDDPSFDQLDMGSESTIKAVTYMVGTVASDLDYSEETKKQRIQDILSGIRQ